MKSITPRIIKFQSVHKHFKTGEIYFHLWGPIDGIGFQGPAQVNGYELIGHRQFTGLTDKAGNEIYEGDILGGDAENKYCGDAVVAVKYSGAGFVCYNPNCCTVCKTGDGCISDLGEALYMGANVVIGNIFSNPELIEGDSTTLK